MAEASHSGSESVLGKFPDHWITRKLKYVAPLINEKDAFDPALLRVENENIESWSGRYLDGSSIFVDRDELKRFRAGDVLFNKLRPYLAKVYHSQTNGFSGGELLVLRPTEELDSRFLFYRLLSKSFIEVVNSSTDGAKMPRADWEFIGQLFIGLPTVSEQRAIAVFLDDRTYKIDNLIEKKRKLIELLKEERQAVINQAVTRGLDPNVKMKPSGIEWLGDVPEHWVVKKLKNLFSKVIGGSTPSTEKAEYWNGNIPWISAKDVKSNKLSVATDFVTDLALQSSSLTRIPAGTLITVFRSGILKHTFPVTISEMEVVINQDLKALFFDDSISSSFMSYLFRGLNSIIIDVCTKQGATVDSIDIESFFNLALILPELNEQNAIVETLVRKTSEIDVVISQAEKSISLLLEYRTSLIAEAVAGRIKMR